MIDVNIADGDQAKVDVEINIDTKLVIKLKTLFPIKMYTTRGKAQSRAG